MALPCRPSPAIPSPGTDREVPVISQFHRQPCTTIIIQFPFPFLPPSPLHLILSLPLPCLALPVSSTMKCDHLGWGGIHRGATCNGTNCQNETENEMDNLL